MPDNLLDSRFQNFPVPALDDRQFDDLMQELRALIPIYCPEWTYHHPADPGITLLELFAYLTDVMLYRINHMPVRNLFAVLNLLGIQPRPPAPARAHVVFEPNPASDGQIVPAGSALSAGRASDEPILFETEEDLLLTTARLVHLYSASGRSTRDLSAWIDDPDRAAFHPFSGTDGLERYLYLGDPRLLTLREPGMRVHLRFDGPSAWRDLYARWAWQYYDGERWIDAPLAVAHEAGEVVLESIPALAETTLEDQTGAWLRAAPLPGEDEPSMIMFRDVRLEVESVDEGVLPTALFLNPGGEVLFSALDVSRTFYPLGEQPKLETAVYILARELFRAAGTRVEMHFVAPPADRYPRPDPTADLELRLEYSLPGNRWGLLRSITPNPFVQPSDAQHQVTDDTRALKRGGVIAFMVPDDLVSRSIQGIDGPWIRLRLVAGEYRPPLEAQPPGLEIAGVYPYTGGSTPPSGPAFQTLLLRSRAPASSMQRVLSFSDFTWMELWNNARPRGTAAAPFPRRQAYTTALYLGFDHPFPQGRHRLFFKIEDDGEAYAAAREREIARQRVRWEVYTGQGFVPLPELDDGTLHLKRDGYVSFSVPGGWTNTSLFEKEAFWIRARLSDGQYDVSPLVRDVRTNVVDALQVETWREDRVLPSDGQPYQEIELLQRPVLDPIVVRVREREPPRGEAERKALIDALGEGALTEDDDGLWTRWRRVDHLVLASAGDRCFAVDPHNGILRFGDGRHGRIPPVGPRSIRIESYRIGGGDAGNVAAHALQVLRESNSLVASVDNPWPADGGAEAEGLQAAAARGTRRMYQVDRAWRAEDYEQLAREASGRVARAHCLEPRAAELSLGRPAGQGGMEAVGGEVPPVRVLVLPKQAVTPRTLGERVLPSEELLERVRQHLEARRPLNVRLQVQGPRYVSFSAAVTVYLRGRLSPGTEEDIRSRLQRWLHPLVGGDDGKGWPLGVAVRRTGLFQAVAACPQVLSVLDVRLYDRQGGELEGAVTLTGEQLPHLTGVRIAVATLG